MHKRIAATLLAAACLFPAAARAATNPNAVPAAYFTCQITTTAATRCQAAPPAQYGGPAVQLIVGVGNNSATAQTATVTCYWNDAAASGPVAMTIGPLGISQYILFPQPGLPAPSTPGLTCQASAAIVGTAVEIYVR